MNPTTGTTMNLIPTLALPAGRYPDPAVQVLAPAFEKYRLVLAAVERIASGSRWAEGPVWFGDGRYLLWSDIPNNRILKWEEETGAVSVFRAPSGHANGNTRDRQGRLVSCEHGGRRITRTEYDGSITVLMDRFDGKRLNSPNDLVVKSDGSIWFTDPPFGIAGYYQGEQAEQELPERLYRLDPATGKATVVAEDISGPNGLAFSPDERTLYVIESRARPRGGRRRHAARRESGAGGCGPRHARRLPCRHRRQPLVRMGHGLARARWRARVLAARRGHRAYLAA
jgi:gluconolactonase